MNTEILLWSVADGLRPKIVPALCVCLLPSGCTSPPSALLDAGVGIMIWEYDSLVLIQKRPDGLEQVLRVTFAAEIFS